MIEDRYDDLGDIEIQFQCPTCLGWFPGNKEDEDDPREGLVQHALSEHPFEAMSMNILTYLYGEETDAEA